MFFIITALGGTVIYFVDSASKDSYHLIGMSILVCLSLLYFFKQVCIRRTGFLGFFFSTYSLVIFTLPFLAYIDGTFISQLFPGEHYTTVEFGDAMMSYPLVFGYFLVLLIVSLLRKPLNKSSKNQNSQNGRSMKYTETPTQAEKNSFVEKLKYCLKTKPKSEVPSTKLEVEAPTTR